MIPMNYPWQALNDVDTFDRIITTLPETDNRTSCRCQFLLMSDLNNVRKQLIIILENDGMQYRLPDVPASLIFIDPKT